MKRILIPSILLFFLLSVSVSAYEFQVKLTLDNLDNKVYIPGTGEVSSSDIVDAVNTNPIHFYLASYLNNVLAGLVTYNKNSTAIAVSKSGSTHSIQVNQNLANSNAILVFTKGNWKTIDNRITLIERLKFLSRISPSFSYGLGLKYPIKLLLSPGIDIANNMTAQRGLHKIAVENTGSGVSIKSI
ncbi:MAG: hypothetical protein ISS36_02135 [Candidatus Aenigmarchaeota archaeon]|nr:hypothetical protein [Candidatus Aenigmarchaeota archaeon]